MITREVSSKHRNDVQPAIPVSEASDDIEVSLHPGKEPTGSKVPQDHSNPFAINQDAVEVTLPSILESPRNLNMEMEDSESVPQVNEPLMWEQMLNMIHDPEISTMVDADWKARGVEAFMAMSIEFMHYVHKCAYCHVKSGKMVTRLRVERDAARRELKAAQQLVKDKEKSLSALEKFSTEVQHKIEKVEKETTEVQQKIVGLTDSLKKAKAATVEAKRRATDAQQLVADEACARERAEKIYSDFKVSFEQNEGV